jgi:uncharacterized protein YbjT (DUF2867 family)
MRILLFGATGNAGDGVLHSCVDAPDVLEVRAVVRRAPAVSHPKISVILHADFMNYGSTGSAFEGIDACFFCLGISTAQASSEAEYRTITMDFAIAAAAELRQRSPHAAFHYLSGQGARLNSPAMWARVKAEAEQALMQSFAATCWRPGYIHGELHPDAPLFQKLGKPVFRLLKHSRNLYVTARELGRAMLYATDHPLGARIVHNREIREIARKHLSH